MEAEKIHALHEAGKDAELPYSGMMLTTMVAEAGRMVKLKDGPASFPMELSGLAIGPVALIGLPGEPFNGIGRALKLNLELIEAISLGHDMGHTPFGHKGELFLSKKYQDGCLLRQGQTRYFNHNVHSVRIFQTIIRSNLTLQTLSGILSHNGEKVWNEYGPSALTDFDSFELLSKTNLPLQKKF